MNRQTSLRSKGRELRALAALAFAVGLIAVAAFVCGCGSQSSSRFGYYRDGNLKSYADAKGQRTTYEYDLLDQVTSVAYPGRERVGYSYDANGNVVGIDASSDSGYTYA